MIFVGHSKRVAKAPGRGQKEEKAGNEGKEQEAGNEGKEQLVPGLGIISSSVKCFLICLC